MKAIRTHYQGPTNNKGSRYVASDGDGNRVTLSADYALNSDENHERAAKALMAKMGWPNTLIGGGFKNDMFWTMIPRNCQVSYRSQTEMHAESLELAKRAGLKVSHTPPTPTEAVWNRLT